MTIRVRAVLVSARTSLVNTARGLAKALGERLPKCDADRMGVPQRRVPGAERLRRVGAVAEKSGIADREGQRQRSENHF
jgi:hypothetical protein